MTDLNNNNNANYQDNHYFIITCHGWSASNWLAYALNSHPDITCAHSSAGIIANDSEIFSGEGLKTHIPNLRKGYVQRKTRSIADQYISLSAEQPNHFLGTVHTYRLRDLPEQIEQFNSSILKNPKFNNVPVLNLVRHPLDLVVSGYGQFKDLFKIDLNEYSWTMRKIVDEGLEIVEEICKKHKLNPGGYDQLCFFGACVVLGSLKLDLNALKKVTDMPYSSTFDFMGHLKMEEVTRDPSCMKSLISKLTKSDEYATESFLSNVYKLDKINRHNHTATEGTLQRWNELADWQKEGFQRFLRHYNLEKAYSDMGYSFDFL